MWEMWILAALLSVTLAAVALAIIGGSFWLAGWCAAKIVPAVDEHGARMRGKAAWRHFRHRANVKLGNVSFFPFRSDHSWNRTVRFHFAIMALLCFQETFWILLREGDRPLHLSLLTIFLPSMLLFSAGVFTRMSTAKHGYAKWRGSGPNVRHRYFSDEEIAERIRAELAYKEATKQYWERKHGR